MNRIILAYCHTNSELADELDRNLVRIGIPFERITDRPEDAPGTFAERLLQNTEPVILFVTDNLLKSPACLYGLLPAVEKMVQSKQFLIVAADGKFQKEDGSIEYVPTQFDRMVYALRYMNYWQNNWLDLSSRQQQAGSEAEKASITPELDMARAVANIVGDIISALKEAGFASLDQLESNAYALFFNTFGLKEWHEQYRMLAVYDTPNLQTSDNTAPLVEMPVISGPLAPMAVETPEINAPETEPDAAEDFSNMNSLLREISEEEPFEVPEDEPSRSEEPIPQPEPENLPGENAAAYGAAEIQQTIDDAWLWLEKGRTEQGMELFALALEQHPDNELLQREYAEAVSKYGAPPDSTDRDTTDEPQEDSFPETQTVFPAVPENPGNEAKSYDLMGDMAAEKGDFLFAKYCWDRAAELDPDFPGIFHKLGIMTSEHLRADYKETAVHYLQKALEQDPNDAEACLWMADTVLQNNNEHSLVEQWYRKAIALDPSLQSPDRDQQYLPDTPVAIPEAAPEETVDLPAQTEEAPVEIPVKNKADILTVLITGATSGIGRATADIFARNGHRLIITGRRAERLSTLKAHFETQYHIDVLMLPFDVRDQRTVEYTLENLPESWQKIDVLVNNAGLAKGLSPIHEGNLEHWETMIDTNIKGLLYVTRAVAPGMVRRRHGHIINLGSSAGKEVYPMGNVYSATKFAVDALTRSMRLDLYTHNIRVSQVSPGHVEETEFAINRFDGDAERAKIYNDFQPLKAADVAEVIYFMATRPPHVNIQDVYMFCSQQASATAVDRSGRGD